MNNPRPLAGRVALVAGATRGAGRGVACMLGEAGATVYCTGRSTEGRPGMEGRPETLEETARRVTESGGDGIALHADHTDEAQVVDVADRIRDDAGSVDILVNSIWGGDPLTEWTKRFWELDLEKGFRMLRQAIHTHIITARHVAPLMVKAGKGLVVEMTDGDGWYYRGNLFYDLVKTSVIRLSFDMAEELRPHGVASLALTPGFLRSEAMLEHFGVTEETWREAISKDPNFAESETPFFVGRAVAALAADPDVMSRSGRAWSSWGLSDEYGFADIDGRRPHWGNHFRKTYGNVLKTPDDAFYAYWQGFETMNRLIDQAFGAQET